MIYHNDNVCIDVNIQNDQPLKWQEPFNDLLDEIYYPGYSKQLLEVSPEDYKREYWYFMQLYD